MLTRNIFILFITIFLWTNFLRGQELSVDNLTILKNGRITWTTSNELEKTIFLIQEFKEVPFNVLTKYFNFAKTKK